MPKAKKDNTTIADLDKAINEQSIKMQNSANDKDYNPSLDELYLARLFNVRIVNSIDCLDNNIDVLRTEIKKIAGYLEEIKQINEEKAKNNNFWAKIKSFFKR